MTRGLVFISHKHSDRAIANVVRSFITEQTRSTVRVFQSSDPTAVTPGIGRTLNADLRAALWNASAVILVYTGEDRDWGYCMWECGVATLPDSPDTRIILFQCGDSAPNLFDGQLGVNTRDKTSIQTFVTQFMTQPRFLSGVPEALTGYHSAAPEVQQAANRFFDDLQAVLPEGPFVEWPAHPYVQLQLSYASERTISNTAPAERQAAARRVVLSDATVSDSDKYFQALFGMAEFDDRVRLQTLYHRWRAAYPERSDSWIESLADQLACAAQWNLPALRWAPMPAVGNGHPYAPVVTRVRKIPVPASLQFDVYFYPFNPLDAVPVQSQMVRRADMRCKVLPQEGEKEIIVKDLLYELDRDECWRIPFLDSNDRLVFIAHRSMLDQFFSRRARTGNVSDLGQLTMADLFAEEAATRTTFSRSGAFIGIEGTLADAKAAMRAMQNCYDVFVTKSGSAQEPVLGWLTNLSIEGSESM